MLLQYKLQQGGSKAYMYKNQLARCSASHSPGTHSALTFTNGLHLCCKCGSNISPYLFLLQSRNILVHQVFNSFPILVQLYYFLRIRKPLVIYRSCLYTLAQFFSLEINLELVISCSNSDFHPLNPILVLDHHAQFLGAWTSHHHTLQSTFDHTNSIQVSLQSSSHTWLTSPMLLDLVQFHSSPSLTCRYLCSCYPCFSICTDHPQYKFHSCISYICNLNIDLACSM